MLLDPVGLAWASWGGLLVGLLGTVVSLVGLVLTFREARRAKIAALSARSAVEKVVALTRSRARLSALSAAVSQADAIAVRIGQDGLKTSRELFTAFRRVVTEALATQAMLDGAGGGGGGGAVVPEIERALDEIASLIDDDIEAKVKEAKMHRALQQILSFLIAQEARARTEDIA